MRGTLPFIAALTFTLSTGTADACSCMGNNSFCETLGSPFFWSDPDAAVAIVVPLEAYHYGMSVRVVQVISGAELPDTVMVWGDNGALCRIGMGFTPGDTVVFGMNATDLMGNVIQNPEYPPGLEHEGDYMVSVCGVHALDYANGRVIGWITGPQTQSLTVAEFAQVVETCSVTQGVGEVEEEALLHVAGNGDDAPVLSLLAQRQARLQVLDATGRCVIDRTWNGSPLVLGDLAPATYVVQLRVEGRTIGRKVVVGGR